MLTVVLYGGLTLSAANRQGMSSSVYVQTFTHRTNLIYTAVYLTSGSDPLGCERERLCKAGSNLCQLTVSKMRFHVQCVNISKCDVR
jgi:hypothetical protein